MKITIDTMQFKSYKEALEFIRSKRFDLGLRIKEVPDGYGKVYMIDTARPVTIDELPWSEQLQKSA